MRALAALACFAVFAGLLIGGIVWASDEDGAASYFVCQSGEWARPLPDGKLVGGPINPLNCTTTVTSEDERTYTFTIKLNDDGTCTITTPDGDAEPGDADAFADACPNGIKYRAG